MSRKAPHRYHASYGIAEHGINFWCIVQAAEDHHLGVLEHLSRLQRLIQLEDPSGLRCGNTWGLCTYVVVSFISYGAAGVHSIQVLLHAKQQQQECKQPLVT